MRSDMAIYLNYLGEATAELGKTDETEHHWLDAMRLGYEAQALPMVLNSLVGLARLRASRGDVALAVDWLGHAVGHPASTQETRASAEKLRSELEAQLAPRPKESIRSQAPAQTLETLVTQLLAW
jgi:hypothetical protein